MSVVLSGLNDEAHIQENVRPRRTRRTAFPRPRRTRTDRAGTGRVPIAAQGRLHGLLLLHALPLRRRYPERVRHCGTTYTSSTPGICASSTRYSPPASGAESLPTRRPARTAEPAKRSAPQGLQIRSLLAESDRGTLHPAAEARRGAPQVRDASKEHEEAEIEADFKIPAPVRRRRHTFSLVGHGRYARQKYVPFGGFVVQLERLRLSGDSDRARRSRTNSARSPAKLRTRAALGLLPV